MKFSTVIATALVAGGLALAAPAAPASAADTCVPVAHTDSRYVQTGWSKRKIENTNHLDSTGNSSSFQTDVNGQKWLTKTYRICEVDRHGQHYILNVGFYPASYGYAPNGTIAYGYGNGQRLVNSHNVGAAPARSAARTAGRTDSECVAHAQRKFANTHKGDSRTRVHNRMVGRPKIVSSSSGYGHRYVSEEYSVCSSQYAWMRIDFRDGKVVSKSAYWG